MSEWQLIETAPAGFPDGDESEDPTKLLVWVANGGHDGKGVVDFGWVYIGRRTGNRRPRASSHSGGDWHITHWMPLPAPPQEDYDGLG